MARDTAETTAPRGITPQTQLLRDALAAGIEPILKLKAGDLPVTVHQGQQSLWILVRRPGEGGMALRTGWSPGGLSAPTVELRPDGARLVAYCAMGRMEVEIVVPDPAQRRFRATTRLTPREDLRLTYWPRDFYPLSPDDGPAAVEVMAAQRGLNAGVVFCALPDPAPGAALYFQNFTALNPYFRATGTRPDGAVGGEGAELGYQPPVPNPGGDPKPGALKAGEPVTISDAIVAVSDGAPEGDQAKALAFLTLLAGAYPLIERPATEYRDWPGRARRSLAALTRSPKLTTRHYGDTYVRPYVDAEHPDSMVQLAVAIPLADYGRWRGSPVLLEERLRKGARRFYDPELGTLRRYLPNVQTDGEGPKKDADEVDSWYLYHPLANVGRYALQGDGQACELFLNCLDFAIRVARHFKYAWPVLFNVKTLKVHTQTRGEGKPGQSDVGGLYAYVMLQAYQLTGARRFLKEAEKGVRAMQGLAFDTLYQTNLTAWGAQACLQLHRLTGDAFYLGQFNMLLAGFFHNTIFWESEIGTAERYHSMLGATCLSDGPYMALYECFESFDAFRECLHLGGETLSEPVRLLLTEYCRLALDRAWFYYPDTLPADIFPDQVRNGQIDRALSIPVEDLYADGQAPGQVGQEVYGVGAAFVYTMRSIHRLAPKAPFDLFCDYPLEDLRVEGRRLTARTLGLNGFECRLRLLARGRALPEAQVTVDGDAVAVSADGRDLQADIRGGSAIEVTW